MGRSWNTTNRGITVVEILVVIVIVLVGMGGILGLVTFSLQVADVTSQTTEAALLSQATLESVRNFRDNTGWDTDGLGTLTVGTDYHPEKTGSPAQWDMLAGTETMGMFTRRIVFSDVYRDANDNIATSGTLDPDTKGAVVRVSWQERGRTHQVQTTTYLTNWR